MAAQIDCVNCGALKRSVKKDQFCHKEIEKISENFNLNSIINFFEKMAFGFLKRLLPSWEKAANDVLSTYIRYLELGIEQNRIAPAEYDLKNLLDTVGLPVFMQTFERLQPKDPRQSVILSEIFRIIEENAGSTDLEVETAIRCHACWTSVWLGFEFGESMTLLDKWTIESCANFGKWSQVRRKAIETAS